MKEKLVLQTRVSGELAQRLEKRQAQTGANYSEILRQALAEHLGLTPQKSG